MQPDSLLAIIATGYQDAKWILIGATGLAKDALHIYAGLAIFIAVHMCGRGRHRPALAWLVTLSFTLGAEGLDKVAEYVNARHSVDSGHWHDIWNTMFWPSVLALLGRWLLRDPRGNGDAQISDADEAPVQGAAAPQAAE